MRYQTLDFSGACGHRTLEVMVAESGAERMRGLLARPQPGAGAGLLLPACRLIHTFGMRYPIDAVYIGADGRVLKVTTGLAPRRIDGHLRACSVLEMAAGAGACCGIVAGVRLPLSGRERP